MMRNYDSVVDFHRIAHDNSSCSCILRGILPTINPTSSHCVFEFSLSAFCVIYGSLIDTVDAIKHVIVVPLSSVFRNSTMDTYVIAHLGQKV